MFIPSVEKTPYKNMDGNYVEKKQFKSPFEARQFIRDHEGIDGYNLYGSTYFDYVWIYDNYKDLQSDNSVIRIGNYDIETDSDGGYADIKTANKEITSISIGVMSDNELYCFGLKDAEPIQEILDREGVTKNVIYIKCDNERDLLLKFVETWQRLKMDVITGWNINGYDHVYLIRRLMRLFGEDFAKSLSPFGIIEESTFMMYGREQTQYDIIGIPTLDYMECYKKFSFKNSESFKLDYISHVVLDKKKLKAGEMTQLHKLLEGSKVFKYDKNKNIKDMIKLEKLCYMRDKIKDELLNRTDK
jgi:DNA polymerase elongation subunit (family B)